jgi:hypothetical protein
LGGTIGVSVEIYMWTAMDGMGVVDVKINGMNRTVLRRMERVG